ncbi:hypothetical protein PIB30_118664 [Stylosanthes scabra]|uniref:Retrotransposon Copia-like N-terminal domain-containing protein n=1 Tax=Stylosanthes scabra TaxID=79078 RepID=A0ABU6W6U8_9FABA|nr:hypothetical protein [Stylosanthes scabra]
MAAEGNPPISSIDLQTLANLLSQINLASGGRTLANPALDPTSPYFLHPGENPGSTIVSKTLTGRAMWRALRGNNKLKFVDGSIQKPSQEDSMFEAWERCNTYVISWITQSLSADITRSVLWINSAEELWKELKYRYGHGDVYRVAEFEEELFAAKQGELSVTYYTKLKTIWEELENVCPIPACSRCVETCTCEVSIMRSYKEESNVVRFLRGLNDQCSNLRSQIMLIKPLPKVETVFASLLQQERQLNMCESLEEKTLIANSRNESDSAATRGKGRGRGGRGNKGGRSTKQCSYCGKNEYLVDVCYKKHGYTPHFKNNGAAINNVIAEDKNDEFCNQSQKGDKGESEYYFTAEQRNALLALLNQQDSQPKHSINQLFSSTNLPSN